MASAVNPKEIRRARAFLQKRGIRTGDIRPDLFARSASEQKVSFEELLHTIANLQMGKQGLSMRRKAALEEERQKLINKGLK